MDRRLGVKPLALTIPLFARVQAAQEHSSAGGPATDTPPLTGDFHPMTVTAGDTPARGDHCQRLV